MRAVAVVFLASSLVACAQVVPEGGTDGGSDGGSG